jgi:PhnB protein
MQVNPYLTFNGNCEEAFKTYQRILGGEIAAMIPYEGTPGAEGMPPERRKQIIHARLVGNGIVPMESDAHDRYEPMKGFSVTVKHQEARRGRAYFQCTCRQGDCGFVARRDLFHHKIRDAHRQVWHTVDDRLREGAVTSHSVHGRCLDSALV